MKKAVIAVAIAAVVAVGGTVAYTQLSKNDSADATKEKASQSDTEKEEETEQDPSQIWLLVEKRKDSEYTRYEYNNDGKCVIDDNGYTRIENTYENGKLISYNQYENGVLSSTRKYEYDNNGNKVKMTDESNSKTVITTYEYDNENRLTKEQKTANVSNFSGSTLEYEYSTNEDGTPIQIIKAYDDLNNHKLMYTQTNELDDNGNVQVSKTEQNNGSWKTEKFDVYGNLLESISCGVNDAKSMYFTDVDEKGHKIRSYQKYEENPLYPVNTPIIDKTYEYDENGNLYREYSYSAIPENEFNQDDYSSYVEYTYKTLAEIRAENNQ